MTNAKEIIFDEEARQKLYSGLKQLADVVACTLGPKGRNIGLEKSWGAPTITNDGSSIVRDFELSDTFENMGVQFAKEVVQKIKEKCGDGTTSGTILLKTLVEHGLRYISAGASPISIKRGIDKSIDVIVKSLEKMATPVTTDKEILNIATVSASSNHEVGEVIAQAISKVGKQGVITIEEAKGTETSIEVVEGMQFDRGYQSAYFCTNSEKMLMEMSNPLLLLVDKKIASIHDLLPVLQSIASTSRELVIIAEDFEPEVLSTLVVNKLRGTLKAAAIKAPGFGDKRKAMLQDIAVLTGATVVTEDAGLTLKESALSCLGKCDKIVSTKDATTIIASSGDKKVIEGRLKQIESEIKAASSSYDREKLEERRAKLSGGVAQIKVGAATEPELKNKKQAFEDSLSSTKAALELGIIPGGGVALLNASKAVDALPLEGDELLGAKIAKFACEAPIRQIISNAGKESSVILAEIQAKGAHNGFNANTETVEDLMKAGVVDPLKVVKTYLVAAASSATIALISEALIADAKEEESTHTNS